MKSKSASKPNQNFIAEGVFVCVNCGSPNTTVLRKVVYCRDCRSFLKFHKKKQKSNRYTGHYDDDD